MRSLFARFCRKVRRAFRPDAPPPASPHVTIGRHTYGIRAKTISRATSAAPVTIGNFCSIAPDVVFLAHVDHRTDLPTLYPFRSLLDPTNAAKENRDSITRGPIILGHDVWVGQRAIVLSGVTIGTGAVIGAGAVVTRDVPAYAIAVGNPARVIRHRFEPDIIERLLASRWWDLPDDGLLALDSALYDTNLARFFEAVDSAWGRVP